MAEKEPKQVKKKRSRFLTKGWIALLGIVAILIALGFLRACTTHILLKNTIYTIGRDPRWYPLNLMGKEKNMLAFTTDLMYEIAKEGGFRYQLVDAGGGRLLDGLENGNYDAILSPLYPTAYNRERFLFSEAFYLTGPVLVIQVGASLPELEKQEGKIVGVLHGFSPLKALAKDPHLLVLEFDTPSAALEQLITDEIDGVVMPSNLAYAYEQGIYAGKIKIASSPLTLEGIRLVAPHDPTSALLIERFNEGLETIYDAGGYDLLIKKWGLLNPLLDKKVRAAVGIDATTEGYDTE